MITKVIVKFLYDDLLMPGDTYPIRARKRVIAFLAPLAIILLCWALYNLFDYEAKVSWFLSFILRLGITMSIFVLWATTRYKRAVTDTMYNAFSFVLNTTFLTSIIMDPNSGIEGALLGSALFGVIFNVQYFFAMSMCFPLLTAVIMAYNKSFGRPGTGHTPVVLPWAKDFVEGDTFVTYIFGIIAATAFVIIVYLQNNEVIRLMAASEAAVSMSREVAGKLAAYDTVGAMAILESATDVDPQLVSSYRLITTNLDKYRAFLPEALLQPPKEDNENSPDNLDVLIPPPPSIPVRFETELQHRKIQFVVE